jgi:hypothetical protein
VTRTASAHGLTSAPPVDWRKSAACLDEDPELFFPLGTEGHWALQIEQAKAVCARCPVTQDCLANALQHPSEGIFGGLTQPERHNLRRQQTRAAHPKPTRKTAPQLPPAKTLREAFNRRTTVSDDGHLLWRGANQFRFRNERYVPLRTAFLLHHGREPEGPVHRSCGRQCVLPEHLTDAVMRDSDDLCGTVPGYNRHRRRGEEACGPCRRANTEADSRNRRASSTKTPVSA